MTYVLPNLSQDRYNAAIRASRPSAQDILANMVRYYRAKGRLSDKQQALVDRLVREAESR